ncbi:MAG: DedA family protein [Candidatus Paceibacterota bacterium]|jgi:membrane-associated protein
MPIITIATVTAFLEAHQILAYGVLFFGSYFETLIGIGFFIYGEMFFLPGAVLAGAGILNIWLVALALFTGGILGDHSSYFIGKHFGMRLFRKEARFFSHTNYQKGQAFFERFGSKSLFFARLAGPFSWITPFLAGVYGVPYRQFFFYNTPGVFTGIGIFIIIGYFFGSNYRPILAFMSEFGPVVLVALIVLLIAYLIIKKRKAKQKSNV